MVREIGRLWLGGVLSFGEGDDAPAISVTMRDVRCSMVTLDPDSASSAPEVLKAVVRANQNNAGIYGAVTRIGRLAVGQTILLRAATEKRETWVIETQGPGTPPNPALQLMSSSLSLGLHRLNANIVMRLNIRS